MKKQVRTVTEGAMLLAFVGVMLIANRITGSLFRDYIVFIMPLPAIFYIAKYGFKQGLIFSIAMIILGLMVSDPVSLFYMITAVVVGLVYGYGIYKDKDNGWLLGWTTLLIATSYFFEMVIIAKLVGFDIVKEVDVLMSLLNELGIKDLPSNIRTLIMSVFPMLMLAAAVGQALVTHMVSIMLLGRLKLKTRSMKPLSQIILPRKLAYVLTLGLFSRFLMGFTNDVTLQIILTNFGVFSLLIFTLDAYILVLIISKLAGKPWLSILVALIFLFMPYIGVSIGLFDSFTDLRKRVLYTYAKPTE